MPTIADELQAWLAEQSGSPVERIETHISWVLLTGDRAYKLKKPVRFEFLDYGDVEARRRACLDEVRLNRRLAPDVYLDVVPLTRDPAGCVALAGPGEAVDWAVAMRRLDEQRTLDDRIRAGACTAADVEALADRLTEFYRSVERVAVRPEDYCHRLRQHVAANRADLLAALPDDEHPRVRAVHGRQFERLALAARVFEGRARDARIVDGHGDLRPEHVYFEERGSVLVFDCLEFSAELRAVDVADELCFLAMECDALSAGWVGRACLERCLAALGDRVDGGLLAFYKTYRACVRAKVAALRSHQVQGRAERQAHDAADRYLRLAEQYSDDLGRPWLIVVRGLMGTGKTTLASRLAEALGARRLSTDVLRRARLGDSPGPADYGAGHYAPQHRRRIYDELLADAEAELGAGGSVVLDGSFIDPAHRARALELASRVGVGVAFLECRCPDEVALARIARRRAEGTDHSEAREDLFERQRRDEQPHAGAARIDTTAPLEAQLAKALAALVDGGLK